MSTLILTPSGSTQEETSEVITLQVVVEDDDFVGVFDRLEVWRAASEEGPYEELTSTGFKTARIPKGSDDPPASPVTGPSVNIVGKSMVLLVDEEMEIPIVFSGVDPLTYATVAAAITAQGLGKVSSYVSSIGTLVVQTTEAGVGAILRVQAPDEDIEDNDAAVVLGLPVEEPYSLSYGKDPRIPLIAGTSSYSFTDPYSSSTYYYKTRFRNASTGAVSEFSLAFGVGQAVGLDQSNLVTGRLDLAGMDGKPLQNVEVRLHGRFGGTLIDEKALAGEDLVQKTDSRGRVEFTLVRGQELSVSIIGTSIFRNIIVPTSSSVSIFNLLDPDISTGDDIFTVQVPVIISAERRSL